jgi:putative hemolysin
MMTSHFMMTSRFARTRPCRIAVATVASLLIGCVGESTEQPGPGLANPASEYCEEQGGQLEISEDAEGDQTGSCVFPDGSSCEEWAFYRGECEPDAGAS